MAHRFLLKDVDTFAGFAHAMHTYLSGVALADRHALSLLHQPFRCAHGFEYAFEDLLAADPRGLVAPLVAPRLSVAGNASLVDGRAVSLLTTGRTADAPKIAGLLTAAPADSVVWVRKGRFAFADGCNCSMNPEVRYTVLWLRERFWRAVRRRHELAITPRLPPSPPSGRTAATPVIICAHVRRGDVTWLDLKGRPSGRWVDTTAVLEVLDGVRQVLGGSLEPPAVEVHLFSEQKGWGRNDTAALLALAPGARVHLEGSAAATLGALVTMASADILLMGSSGFSTWAALFSCGVKVGPPGHANGPPLPMRHVPFSNTLTTRGARFADAALPLFRREWTRYARCKADAACGPTLCAARHLSDPRWAQSRLARVAVADDGAAQWRVPPPALAAAQAVQAAAARAAA